MRMNRYFLIAGGRIKCRQCLAKSSRTGNQCQRPALAATTSQKCQYHVGREDAIHLLGMTNAPRTHGRKASGYRPVHTLSEITKLKNLFPHNIRQFNVYNNEELLGGTTVFVNKKVVHSQYISGNEMKNVSGSLDFLHNHLIKEVFKEYHYHDFGICNEYDGRKINKGLLFWKESFGAKTVIQNFYEVETINYSLLETVF